MCDGKYSKKLVECKMNVFVFGAIVVYHYMYIHVIARVIKEHHPLGNTLVKRMFYITISLTCFQVFRECCSLIFLLKISTFTFLIISLFCTIPHHTIHTFLNTHIRCLSTLKCHASFISLINRNHGDIPFFCIK